MESLKRMYRRWMLRRIILVLQDATESKGLHSQVVSFCRGLEATYDMSRGQKLDAQLTITCTKEEVGRFLSYMISLHNSKQSLLVRARIGLVSLLIKDRKLMPDGQDPMEFAEQAFAESKSSKDDNRIQIMR